jgi:hypothetical protein
LGSATSGIVFLAYRILVRKKGILLPVDLSLESHGDIHIQLLSSSGHLVESSGMSVLCLLGNGADTRTLSLFCTVHAASEYKRFFGACFGQSLCFKTH